MSGTRNTETLALDGELTIFRAAELKTLLAGLSPRSALELNLEGVAEVDTAGLQLLEAARRAAAAAGAPFRLRTASPALIDAIRLMGLHELLLAVAAKEERA